MLRQIFTYGLLALILSSCQHDNFAPGGVTHYIPAPAGYANEQSKISLLNPTTRYIIHCFGEGGLAEECARHYEQKNYVRYRDIPYKTAKYDFLTRETYPTRRWREHERTPRW